jgi:hypothetical protein
MHLSRRRKVFFIAEHALRPGDGSVGRIKA